MKNKVVPLEDAVALIHDGDTICTSGFVGIGTPEELLDGLEQRFIDTKSPSNLTLVFAAGQGDGKDRGLNKLGHDGLLKRVVGGHWGLIPKVAQLAVEGKIEAYNLPQGCISHLFRAIAADQPGVLSSVGTSTFVDPRLEGGKINSSTLEDLVEVVEIGGAETLFYKAMPINVALIRGTTADTSGNITMEREALTLDNLAMAMAARNSGGLVIAQVERIARQGTLNPRDVEIPATLVDCVVVAKPENHQQTYATPYSAGFSGEVKVPTESMDTMALDVRKIIARRCAFELPINGVINLGIGMPEGVASVAAEEGLLDLVTLTAEPGVIGGLPASGLDFGAAINTDAVIHQNQQFDFYDGGGLDLACLGMAECDQRGNVNVSRFGTRLAGAGGFINISQSTHKLLFAGTFSAGGLAVDVVDQTLQIQQEGRARKFVEAVQQITFSGERATDLQQSVLYVTERCVFDLCEKGIRLIEIAPGVDLEKDILSLMAFEPIIESVATMDSRIFAEASMALKQDLLDIGLENRISFHEDQNILFLNFEYLEVRRPEDITAIRRSVEARCKRIDHRVDVVVNYCSFQIEPELADEYASMVAYMEQHYYRKVSRYATSAFMRKKLGKMLTRKVSPHVFENRDDAKAFLHAGRE